MQQKFLLYIDFLGFRDIVASPERIRSLYMIVDSLNAHKHHSFTTIVFSDTILVYNKVQPANEEDRKYYVMVRDRICRKLAPPPYGHWHLFPRRSYLRRV